MFLERTPLVIMDIVVFNCAVVTQSWLCIIVSKIFKFNLKGFSAIDRLNHIVLVSIAFPVLIMVIGIKAWMLIGKKRDKVS